MKSRILSLPIVSLGGIFRLMFSRFYPCVYV